VHTERLTRNLSDPKGDLNRVLGNAEKISTNLASKKSWRKWRIPMRKVSAPERVAEKA
jgi:hypothetical protein